MTVVLLGPQRFDPTVAVAAEAVGITGRIALVTAGWQEREAEDGDLMDHLGGRSVNLELHRRADDVFKRDPELAKAYRARQDRLRQLQDFYRVRLEYLVKTAAVIAQRSAPKELLEEEKQLSVEALRVLDRYHIARCRAVHEAFWEVWNRHERAAIAKHREEIHAIIDGCEAIAIAGGHVATILNRLRLFDIREMVGARPLLAWSAGAMAVTQRVALFHDYSPHGVSAPELLDGGLNIVTDIVALPHPEKRLRLDEAERVAMYARRFKPAHCLAFPRRSWVVWREGTLTEVHGVKRLGEDGTIIDIAEGSA